MPATAYGDISPRTAAFAAKDLLKRGIPYLILEKFGQAKPLPTRSSKTITFRRYNALDKTPNALTEGVTPASKQLTKTDISATCVQYGDHVEITDIVLDTHEDPVLQEGIEVLGEQAAQMIETVRYNKIKAGTNVFYANGAARADVNTTITLSLQRKITRSLKRQNAKMITKVVRSTPSYGTMPVAPAYIGLCHTDVEADIQDMTGFIPVEEYGQLSPYEGEIGKVGNVRYIVSTIFESFVDSGGLQAGGGYATISTTGVNSDVYPIIYIGRDSYGIVPLKGKNAITPMVVNPKPSDSDPLAQRGHIAWKSMQTAVILNDLWMVRAEVAVKENP